MKRRTVELYLVPAFLFVLLILPHLFFFGNYYVDVEPKYVNSALEISNYGLKANLTDYFNHVANPTLTLVILSTSYRLFWEAPEVSRLTIFLISAIFSFFVYFYIRKKTDFFVAILTSTLFIVNPFFAVYSQYVHTDVPFMVFSSVAMLLIIFAYSYKEQVLSSIFLGAALATKYVTVVLFPVIFLYSVMKNRIFKNFSFKNTILIIRFNVWYFSLSIILALPFILWVFVFQDSILSKDINSTLSSASSMFFSHLFAYILWLGLFIGPFCLIVIYELFKKVGMKKFLILIASMIIFTGIISVVVPVSSLHSQGSKFGEMNLGWVESVVPELYLSSFFFIVLVVAELFIVGAIYNFIKTKQPYIRKVLLWLIIPIVIMSLQRAANRYLLVILLPLSLYSAVVTMNVYSKRTKWFILSVLIIHVLIFVATGIFSNYYLHQRGLEVLAAQTMSR